MDLTALKLLSPEALFLHWVRERHQIYLRRKAGMHKPWTLDPILQSTFFTNVYRELDKTTAWYRQHIREPLGASPAVLFATIAFRWFNLPSTGELLLGGYYEDKKMSNLLQQWDEAEAIDRLAHHRDAGNQIFTGAFNISNGGSSKPKVSRVCEDYITPAWEALQPGGILRGIQWRKCSLDCAHDALGLLPGMGGSGFMAGQVVCDLKYTYLLEDAPDWWTWCSPGPGSRRGLNILFGRVVDAPVPKDWTEQITRLRALVARRLPKYPPLHAQDLQNCLCEMGKYHAALHGARSKRKYQGGY